MMMSGGETQIINSNEGNAIMVVSMLAPQEVM